jgi:hypothetical protein
VIVRTNWMRAASGGGGHTIFVSFGGGGAEAQPARITVKATMVAVATPKAADMPARLRLPNIAISFEIRMGCKLPNPRACNGNRVSVRSR